MSQSTTSKVKIPNRLGMHARPAMLFVETASKFDADVRVRRCDRSNEIVDGKSIMQMMMLAATQGTEIEITAAGRDAESAVKDLVALVEGGFQED